MIFIYGIPNCDTIRKARTWLEQHDLEYTFHDYRKDGVPEKKLKQWCEHFGWEKVLNRRGTTWRKLDQATKESVDKNAAIELMQANPAMIKRPLLSDGKMLVLGFKPEDYAEKLDV